MSDRPSEVTAFMQPMHVSSASLGRAAGWLKCRCAALNVSGFPAVLAGLLLFSPLIDGGTTQLPVLII
ncbi:MAG TPA: hypothetical protein VFM24_05590, partial [Nitrospira sp.]|nr:hypothetical protein [Nitrospira sp.]